MQNTTRICVNDCKWLSPLKEIPIEVLDTYPNLKAKGCDKVGKCLLPALSRDIAVQTELYFRGKDVFMGTATAQLPFHDCPGFTKKFHRTQKSS